MSDLAAAGPPKMRIRNRVLNFDSPKVMGILNVTPDSFSDGGEYNDPTSALGRIGLMISQGATIIDIGGESTRPGSEPVSEQEELERVVPVLEKAIPQFPDTLFSIDTTKFAVAEKALQLGVHFVNDVSGLKKEPRLAGLCTKYNAAYILMHSQGRPKTMQDNPTYDDVMADINSFFKENVAIAKQTGLQSIIVDPGIGFGKTLDHNIRILKNLEEFKNLGYPLLIGASRKKMIGELLNGRETSGRLIGTIAVHYHAMLKGANIIRVHDVKEAHDSVLVYNALKK